MDQGNLLQMLLLRGLGTTTLVADRLRYVTQEWVQSGKLDPTHASALVEDVLRALRAKPRRWNSRPSVSSSAIATNSSKTWALPGSGSWMNCGAASIGWRASCAKPRAKTTGPIEASRAHGPWQNSTNLQAFQPRLCETFSSVPAFAWPA